MSKRINVMISDEINSKLDKYAERYGISKSGIVGFVVGQWVDSMEKVNNAVYGATGLDGFLGMAFNEILKDKPMNFNNNSIGCSCYKCGAKVPAGVENHFTAEDGRILCDKCSVGVKPCSEETKKKLTKSDSRK